MKTIYKYPLGDIHHNSVIEIEMPKAAKILDIQYQGDTPFIWALVNPKHKTRTYTFHVFGTGFELTDYDKKHYEHVATLQDKKFNTHTFVWHVFEIHEH